MLHSAQLAEVLESIELTTARGPWSRALGFHYLLGPPPGHRGPPQPLWGGAAKLAGARFTPQGSFESIYLAHDPITAFVEISALISLPGGPAPIRSAPWVIVTVDGMIANVLDLTSPSVVATLEMTEQELSASWAKLARPASQNLGRAAFDGDRISGIRYRSVKHPGGVNLVVFPEKISLSTGNYLEVYDPNGKLAQRIGATR